jgi:site-specific recombinase XerD
MRDVERIYLEKSIESNSKKYNWTTEQRETFIRFKNERYANYSNPEETVKKYLYLLNSVVKLNKYPFAEMTRDDVLEVLRMWQQSGWSETTIHGRKCKLKVFLRWESRNKHGPRVEDTRAGKYISPITIGDLLTENEIRKLREAARDSLRD